MTRGYRKVNYKFYYSKRNQVILLSVLVVLFYVFLTYGYGLLNTTLKINTDLAVRPDRDIRIISVIGPTYTNGAYETSSYEYSHDFFAITGVLPNNNSTIEYTLVVENRTDVDKELDSIVPNVSASGINHELVNFQVGDEIPAHETVQITIRFTRDNKVGSTNFRYELVFVFDNAYVDITPPTITFDPEATDSWTNQDISVLLTATDDRTVTTFKYCISNSTCTPNIDIENNEINLTLQEGQHVICALAIDNAKTPHTTSVCTSEYKIDKSAPTMSISGNTQEWTKDKTLVITATDSLSGLAPQAYSFDNGLNWQANNSKVITTNGTYTLKVRDNLGHVTTQTIEITYIIDPHANITHYDNNLGYTTCDTVQCALDELYDIYK